MATLIKPDGTSKEVFPKDPNTGFTLEEVYDMIEGDMVEAVPVSPRVTMLINEHGKDLDLPVNPKATALVSLFPGDYIAGPAVLVSGMEFQ